MARSGREGEASAWSMARQKRSTLVSNILDGRLVNVEEYGITVRILRLEEKNPGLRAWESCMGHGLQEIYSSYI